jgi:hypothetical protein
LSLSSLRNLARDLITHIINPSIYHFLKLYEFFFVFFLGVLFISYSICSNRCWPVPWFSMGFEFLWTLDLKPKPL